MIKFTTEIAMVTYLIENCLPISCMIGHIEQTILLLFSFPVIPNLVSTALNWGSTGVSLVGFQINNLYTVNSRYIGTAKVLIIFNSV